MMLIRRIGFPFGPLSNKWRISYCLKEEAYMGSGAIKWHVHCSVCGAFIEKSAQSDSEVECKKCRSTLEIFVKDDMVSVRPIHIRDEQLKSRMRTYSRKMMNQGS